MMVTSNQYIGGITLNNYSLYINTHCYTLMILAFILHVYAVSLNYYFLTKIIGDMCKIIGMLRQNNGLKYLAGMDE